MCGYHIFGIKQPVDEVQFYLISLNCDARKLEQVIRLHWGVENGLH
ncbi:Transposase, IS4 [Richelia intracellularis]|nr:Transposase, IS4 [Richelia intracellularis]